jgi:hypothetical protein
MFSLTDEKIDSSLSFDDQNSSAVGILTSQVASTPKPGKSSKKTSPAPVLPNPDEHHTHTVTHLWSHVQENQQEILADVQKDIEKLHGVFPNATKPKHPNVPGIYDPMKVNLLLL